jgi:hypothetical protein
MNKVLNLLTHLTVILAMMFAVFLVLDQFNPMMNFVDNGISRVLLALLCAGSLARGLLHWKAASRERS